MAAFRRTNISTSASVNGCTKRGRSRATGFPSASYTVSRAVLGPAVVYLWVTAMK